MRLNWQRTKCGTPAGCLSGCAPLMQKHPHLMQKTTYLIPKTAVLMHTMRLLMQTATTPCLMQPDNGGRPFGGGSKEKMMRNIITPAVLNTMIPQEFEDWRDGGEDLRRELTHAVMRDLTCPAGWDMNGEYRSEFGGFPRCRSVSLPPTAISVSRYAAPVISARPGWWCLFLPVVALSLLCAHCQPGRRRLSCIHSAWWLTSMPVVTVRGLSSAFWRWRAQHAPLLTRPRPPEAAVGRVCPRCHMCALFCAC